MVGHLKEERGSVSIRGIGKALGSVSDAGILLGFKDVFVLGPDH